MLLTSLKRICNIHIFSRVEKYWHMFIKEILEFAGNKLQIYVHGKLLREMLQ